MVEVGYCTREDVKLALDTVVTSRYDTQIDREILASSRSIDRRMRRVFYPTVATRTFDWLDHQYSLSWRLWLDQHELAAPPTQVTSGGADITSGVLARPDAGPPYTRLEIDLSSNAAFQATSTYQRAIHVTGTFGYTVDTTPGGTVSGLSGTAGITATVSDGALVGVGSILLAGSEYLVVTGKGYVDTGDTIQADMAIQPNINAAVVPDGSRYAVGEYLLVDSEKMLITDIAGNTLLVQRQWDGTPLAAHTAGAAVYVQRQVTVARGQLGTTAASHTDGTAINVHAVPSLIRTLCVAESLVRLSQERTGYNLAINRGEMTKTGVGIEDLWTQALDAYQRKIRTRAPARFL